MPRTATGSVWFTCSTCIYIVNSPFASREDMFENLGAHCPGVRNVHFRLPSWLKGVTCLKLPIVTEQRDFVRKNGYQPILSTGVKVDQTKNKPLSVLQFLNTQLDVMTNATSLKSNQINSFTVEAHVLNVRPFLIELQFGSVGF